MKITPILKSPILLAAFAAVSQPITAQADSFNWKDFTSSSTQNWSSDTSWTGGTAPDTSDPTLILNYDPTAPGTVTSDGRISTSFTSNNDLGTVQLNRLNLLGESDGTNTARLITISGGTLDFHGSDATISMITGASATNNRPVGYTIASALTLNTSLMVDSSATTNGTLTLGGAINLGTNDLHIKSKTTANANLNTGAVAVSGSTLTGSGNIIVEGGYSSFTTITGPSFTGGLQLRSGVLAMGASNLLSSANAVSTAGGSSISLGNNNHTWAGINDIAGSGGKIGLGANNGRQLTLGGSGNYSFSGILVDRIGTPGANARLSLIFNNGSGSQKLSGANTFTGTTTLLSGTVEVTSLANGGLTMTTSASATAGATSLQLASVAGLSVGQLLVANGIADGTTITQINAETNTVTLSTGITTTLASASSLVAGTGNSLGLASNAAANLILTNGSTLKYTGSGHSTDRLFTISGGNSSVVTIESSGTGALELTNTGTIATQNLNATRTLTLTGTNTDENTLRSTLTNSGTGAVSVTKTGAGQWILSGTNTYTGDTTVNLGTLIVDGSLTSALRVNSGTTGGTGSTTGNITIGDGSGSHDARISPGSTSGSLTTSGSLSILADGEFVWTIDSTAGTAGSVRANGISLNAASLFSFNDIGSLGGLTVGDVFTVLENTGGAVISGTFSNLANGSTFTLNDATYEANYFGGNGNDLTLTVVTVVPEPGTWALLGLGGAAILFWRRRTAC